MSADAGLVERRKEPDREAVEQAARAFCHAYGSNPDFFYDGKREWQKVGFIDFDYKWAYEENERDNERLSKENEAQAQRIRELEAKLAAETERCARIAETYDFMWTHQQVIGDKIAAAIRAGAPR